MSGPVWGHRGETAHYTWIPGDVPGAVKPTIDQYKREAEHRLEIEQLKKSEAYVRHIANERLLIINDLDQKLREAEEMIDMARAYQHQLNIHLLEEHKEWTARNILERNTP